MLAPAPAATPLTAAMTGSGKRRSVQDQRLVARFSIDVAEVGGAAAGRHHAVAQVLAGAEAAAGAGHDEHARRVVALDRGQGIPHFGMHHRVEAVEAIRAVESQPGDAVR